VGHRRAVLLEELLRDRITGGDDLVRRLDEPLDPGSVAAVGQALQIRADELSAADRVAARALAHGRALDCFTFTGAFALHLAHVCESVIGLDISAQAIAAARRNAELNGAANIDFREANVFDALRELETRGEQFDTIVLDPPAFAKNRASIKSGARGYKEINRTVPQPGETDIKIIVPAR